MNTQLQNLYGLAAKAILPLIPHVFVVSSERIAHNALELTGLSRAEIEASFVSVADCQLRWVLQSRPAAQLYR